MILAFGSPDKFGYSQNLYLVLYLLPILAGTTYLLLYYLVPRYLLKRRFFLFGLFTCYTVTFAAWLEMMVAMGLYVLVYKYQMSLLNPKITDLGYQTGIMVLVILPALAIQITRQWYRERQVNDRLQQEKLELELYAREKELDYLKEQMNPHFLFNVLNNLYGLTLEKSDQAPEMVLKVSEMLDYMLYRSSNEQVPLQDEIDHIKNYTDIQMMRIGDKLKFNMQLDPQIKQYRIAPMLLLPLVENSFKHGVSTSGSYNFIEIKTSVNDGRLNFVVTNSLAGNAETSSSGVGMKNLKKRLSLLYDDGQYELTTQKTKTRYIVDLSIPVIKNSDEKVEMHDR